MAVTKGAIMQQSPKMVPGQTPPVYLTEEAKTDMTNRQLASTVRQGKRVIFALRDEEYVEGYLAGWDEQSYFVLAPNEKNTEIGFDKVLIFKHSINYIELPEQRRFREEPAYDAMKEVNASFRDYINAQYFPPRNA